MAGPVSLQHYGAPPQHYGAPPRGRRPGFRFATRPPPDPPVFGESLRELSYPR
jgi:hypothetical protein